MNTITFLKKEETYVTGVEMLKRGGSEMAGHEDLDYYLKHQDEIPKKYRKNNYLIFGGVTKTDVLGFRYVAYLRWGGNRWVLLWFWLEYDFFGGGLLVRARRFSDSGSLGSSRVLGPLDELEAISAKIRKEVEASGKEAA